MSAPHPTWGDRILLHVLLFALGAIAGLQIHAAQLAEAHQTLEAARQAARIGDPGSCKRKEHARHE